MRFKKLGNSSSDRLFNILNLCIWAVILLVIIYPLYIVVIASVSDPDAVLRGQVMFLPVNPSLSGYRAIFKYNTLWRSYLNSIIYTVSGTALSVITTLMAAYALSNTFKGKWLVNMFFIFTMFFSGGLIPSFLAMRDIGLYNNPMIMVLSGMVSVWNMMVARTYITSTIPNELYDAARMDGASHFRIFISLILPLSSTIVAVLSVYYAIGKWNDYFTGLVYLKDRNLLPLQTVLREILAALQVNIQTLTEMFIYDDMKNALEQLRIAEVAKYCAIVVSTVPAVVLYLFMQDYFVKGVMIGSIKG